MKTWLITGGSKGLGKELINSAMRNRDFVITTFRRPEEVINFNESNQGKAISFQLDLLKNESIASFIKKINDEKFQIDVLVNNAGVGFVGAIEETSLLELQNIIQVNTFSIVQIVQGVLPQMRANKTGRIINVSSHGGVKAFGGFGAYNMSKFALEAMSESLFSELQPLGIKVHLIEPGPFRTNFAGSSLMEAEVIINDYQETATKFRDFIKSVDGKQEGDPKKAAEIIVDLVSNDKLPFRLPLGKIALNTISTKAEELLEVVSKEKRIAESAVF